MIAQEKANELVKKFQPYADWSNEYGSTEKQANIKHAKNCAIICCDEVMNNVVQHGAAWHEYNEIKNELLKM